MEIQFDAVISGFVFVFPPGSAGSGFDVSLSSAPSHSFSFSRSPNENKRKRRKNSLLFLLLIIIYLFIQHIAVANGRNFLSSSPNCFTLIGLCRRLSAACSHSLRLLRVCAIRIFLCRSIFRRTRFNFGKGNRHTQTDKIDREDERKNTKKSHFLVSSSMGKKSNSITVSSSLCRIRESSNTSSR